MSKSDIQLRICIGANHQPGCSHRPYMRHGIEDYLASDEVRAAIRAYGLPIAPGESGDLVVERMVAFLNQGVMERYGR